MPELPEVETIRRGLSDLIIDKKILEVVNDWPKSLRINSEELDNYVINARFRSVDRRAKLLILNLSTGYSLIIHLKMTGQVVYDEPAIHFGAGHPSDSLIAKLPDKTTRVIFNLNKSAKLYFNDMRKFGWIKLLKSEDLSSDEFIKNLGQKGNYLNFANVYNRQGQTCHVCGEIIIKIRVAGRGTHYCPNCQKLKTAQ